MVGISQEIWCSNRETRTYDKKNGDSRENRESWQVWCKSGFTALVDFAVTSVTSWKQVYRLDDFNCTVLYCTEQ